MNNLTMAISTRYESSPEIGVFSLLTNSYGIVGLGGGTNFYSSFELPLSKHIPIIKTTVSSTNIIGTLIAGNKNGLLVPHTINDTEF